MKIYIGIDNGITGSIGIITVERPFLYPTPSFSVQDYTKKKQNISRLDRYAFRGIIQEFTMSEPGGIFIIFEHPFWNPMLSPKASKSGVMCFESQLSIIEDLVIPYEVIPSKKWQVELLPAGIKGAAESKHASRDVGLRLFPLLSEEIRKHGDADGLLMAEWARRKGL